MPTKKYRKTEPNHPRISLRDKTTTPCPRCEKLLVSVIDEYGDYLDCLFCGYNGYYEPINSTMGKAGTRQYAIPK